MITLKSWSHEKMVPTFYVCSTFSGLINCVPKTSIIAIEGISCIIEN